MAKIYKYQKVTDQFTTHCLSEPDYSVLGVDDRITELCTIDGVTYVSVPDNIELPIQPREIKYEIVELTEELVSIINAASDHVRLVNDRVVERIRERYSVNDEIKMLRIGPSPETAAYNEWVEGCRAWGRTEKEKLMGTPLKSTVASWLSSKEAMTERMGDLQAVPAEEIKG